MIKINYKRSLFNFINRFLPLTRLFFFKRGLANLCGIKVDKKTSICSNTNFIGTGKIQIGKNCWIGTGTTFIASENIFIGDNVAIAPFSLFICGSHDVGEKFMRAGRNKSSPIIVEKGCWICAKSTILGGVHLKKGSIVAAGSTLLPDKKYKPNSLYAGVPAIYKKKLKS